MQLYDSGGLYGGDAGWFKNSFVFHQVVQQRCGEEKKRHCLSEFACSTESSSVLCSLCLCSLHKVVCMCLSRLVLLDFCSYATFTLPRDEESAVMVKIYNPSELMQCGRPTSWSRRERVQLPTLCALPFLSL